MAGDSYPSHPFGFPASTTVYTLSGCTATASPVSFSLPVPKRVVFIELPDGLDLGQDGLDRYYAKLVARLEGTNVVPVVLVRGAKAVAADGPKYGVEETLGDYTYKVWGETKAEVMAMKAEVCAATTPKVIEPDPKTYAELEKRIADKYANGKLPEAIIMKPGLSWIGDPRGAETPTPLSWLDEVIGGATITPSVASAEEMFAKTNERYAKSNIVLPAGVTMSPVEGEWVDGSGKDKPVAAATIHCPPGADMGRPVWAWEPRPGDKEEIAASHADGGIPVPAHLAGEVEKLIQTDVVACGASVVVLQPEEKCPAPAFLVYSGESGRAAIMERAASGLRGEAAVILNRELRIRGLRPDGKMVDPASIRATPDGIAYAFKG